MMTTAALGILLGRVDPMGDENYNEINGKDMAGHARRR